MRRLASVLLALFAPSLAVPAHAGENLALGKPYTLDPAPNYPLCTDPGDATQLTDGRHSTGRFWSDKATVGWVNSKPVIITIDLGSVRPISGVSFNTAAGTAGVKWPESISILVSDDGRAFYVAGELISLSARTSTPPPQGYAVHCFRTDQLGTHGRYVALVVTPGEPCAFVDEIEVLSGNPSLLSLKPQGRSFTAPKNFFALSQTRFGIARRLRADVRAVGEATERTDLPPNAKEQIKSELAAAEREMAEVSWPPEDFRTILPLNAAHERVFHAQAHLWGALGAPLLSAWPADPWAPLSITQAPPGKASAPLSLSLMQHEYRAAALNISLSGSLGSNLKLQILGLPGGPNPAYIGVDEVLWTDTKSGTPVAAALQRTVLEKDAYSISATPGLTRQVWLTVHLTNIPPGLHAGRVLVSSGSSQATVPLSIHLYPFRFPGEPSLHLGGWDYTDADSAFGFTPRTRTAFITHLQEHFVDSPWATPAVLPAGKYGSPGAMTAAPDTTRFDQWLHRWPGARQYCVFANVQEQFDGSRAGTSDFNQKVKTWILFWAEHVRRAGLKPQQLVLLLVDEPGRAEQDALILPWAKAIHSANTGVKVWEDPRHDDPRKANQQMMAACDVLCPHWPSFVKAGPGYRDYYVNQRDKGKELAFFSGFGPVRTTDPYACYRLQPWHCWHYGAHSSYFWSFADSGGGSSWNEYAAPHYDFSPMFLDPTSVTRGKHMEALREGVEDYDYLVMLRDGIAQAAASPAKARAVEHAKGLLSEAAARVCGARGADAMQWADDKDRTAAEMARIEILEALSALQ